MKKILVSFSLFFFVLISGSSINASNIDSEFTNWTNIGGNSSNSKVTYVNPITSEEDIEKKIDINGRYREPIIVDDIIYSLTSSVDDELKAQGYSSSLDGYDLNGNLVKRIGIKGAPLFFSRLTTDGEDTIYVALKQSVQAIDIENEVTLWESEGSSKQVLTQLVYHDGFLYGGAVTKASASQTPSDGYYFAIDTSKDDPSKDDEIIDYAWTWGAEDVAGNGFYWDGAAIVKDSIVFVGDRGLVVSHHLKKSHVYDQVDLNDYFDDTNKVRSTINYNAYKDELLVVTQNSKAMFKIKMNGNKFDKENVQKNLAAADQMSGGPAISKKENGYIYAPSGGMNANAFTIYDAETLEQKFSTKEYGTQSYPLVNVAAADGYEYIYFIDYKTGDMVIAKYNGVDDPTFTKFSVSSTGKSPTYNSGSVIAANDGTLVITKHDGGAIFIMKPKTNAYTTAEMDTVIDNLVSVEKLDYYDKAEVKQVYYQYNLVKAANEGYSNEKIEALDEKIEEISSQKVADAVSELDSLSTKENPTFAELENALIPYGKLYKGDKSKVDYEKYDNLVSKQINVLLSADIEALPVGDAIKLEDYKQVLSVYKDFENASQKVKDLISQSLKDKLDAAYAIAKDYETKAQADALVIEEAINLLPEATALNVNNYDTDKESGLYDEINKVSKSYEEAAPEVQDFVASKARTKIIAVKNKIDAFVFELAIDKLPALADITLDDKEEVFKVNDDLNNQSSGVKSAVPYSKRSNLTKLVNRIKILQLEVDINNLPTVEDLKYADKEKVDQAGNDYNSLTGNDKKTVNADAKAKLTALQDKMAEFVEALQTMALAIDEKVTALPEINEITLAYREDINAVISEYNAASDDVKSYVTKESKDKLETAEDKLAALDIEVLISELPKLKDLTTKDKAELDKVIKAYQESEESVKDLLNKDSLEDLLALADKMNLLSENEKLGESIEDLEDQVKELSKPYYKSTKKGNTTYYYKINSSRKYDLYKKVEKVGSKTTTRNYRTTGSKKLKSKEIITKKGSKTIKKANYKYNTKAKLTSAKVQKLSKSSFVTTYSNTKTYYKNLTTVKTSKTNYKNLSNKYTTRKATTYTSKGKKATYIKLKYKNGVKNVRYEYKYNSKGQLKSNRSGKAYRYYTSFNKKGNALKTTRKQYKSNGDLSPYWYGVKVRTNI